MYMERDSQSPDNVKDVKKQSISQRNAKMRLKGVWYIHDTKRQKKYYLRTIHIFIFLYPAQLNEIFRKRRCCDTIFFLICFFKLNLHFARVTSGGRASHDDTALYITDQRIKSVFGLGTMKKPVVSCLVEYSMYVCLPKE